MAKKKVEDNVEDEVNEVASEDEMPLVPLRKSEIRKVEVEITGKTPILMNNPR